MTNYENIISFESLYKAHRRARLGKRHKKEVIEFEINLAERLWELHYDLKYGRYQVSGYHSFMIYDPKEREIQAITYRDRIVQHSICDNYLMPLLEKHLIYDNAACRKNKGTHFALARLRKFMTEHYKKHGEQGYFVKIDIKKYFLNIDHVILKKKLLSINIDKKIMALLEVIIDSYSHHDNAGLPMGNQTSQCFALLYLDAVDRLIKEKLRIKHYIRYMDDLILLVENKEKAQDCLKTISDKIIIEKLNPNEKSQIIQAKNGIEFLGWYLFFGKNGEIVQKVRKCTKKRIIKKIRTLRYQRLCRHVPKSRFIFAKISYKGHLFYGNGYFFQKKALKLFALSV